MQIDEAKLLLAQLANTRSVVLGPVGVAAAITPETKAYQALAADAAILHVLQADLRAMTQAGASGGRIYAALLLKVIDPEGARRALEAMLSSEEPCSLFPGGCMSVSWWLGEAAGYLLGRPFSHPKRLLFHDFEILAGATDLFELPEEDVRSTTVFAGTFASLCASQMLPELRPQLESLLASGKPAARLYAALLVRKLDPAAGEARLLTLANDAESVQEIKSGRRPRWTTVAEIARRHLPDTLIATLPPTPEPTAHSGQNKTSDSVWSRLLDWIAGL